MSEKLDTPIANELPQLEIPPESLVESPVTLVKTNQKKPFFLLLLLLAMVFVSIGVWLFTQNQFSQKQVTEDTLEEEMQLAEELSPTPNPGEFPFEEDQSLVATDEATPSPTVAVKSGVYTVKMTLLDSLKKPTTQNGYFTLVKYLASRLKFSADEAAVYFDTRITQDMNRDSGMFNGQYILWLKSGLLETPIEDEDGFVKLLVTSLDEKIIPYLHNPQTNANDAMYCEVNGDCSVRDNICSIGAYNSYQIFVDVYGCGPDGQYEISKDGSCWRKKKLSNPRCIKNTCTATVELGVCQSGP